MKKMRISRVRGYTLLEMEVSVAIFSLFLVFMYATFEAGLRTWQIGAVRSDLQQSAEVAMKRIVRDITFSNMTSLGIETWSGKRIFFETPIDPANAVFAYDENKGVPIWQGYIIYYIPYFYTPPPDGITLYRRYLPRTPPGTLPLTLTNAYNCANSGTIVTRNLQSVDFLKEGSMITISIKYQKNIRTNEVRVAFSNSLPSNKGIETFELKTSVMPKN